MGVFVPILRAAMLFLNVWESYKTLLPPPPSKKNGGRPSVRATSQRKRDMKGTLAVWIVWCFFVMYENTIDGTVRIFVPFYDEFKSVMIIFLMLARARGAEPIYLHLIRPVLKPYTSTIDFLLDFAAVIGDFLFAVLLIPLHLANPYLPKRMQLFDTGAQPVLTPSEFAESNGSTPSLLDIPSKVEGLPDSNSDMPFRAPYNGPPTPPPDAPRPTIIISHASQLGSTSTSEDNTPFVPPPLVEEVF